LELIELEKEENENQLKLFRQGSHDGLSKPVGEVSQASEEQGPTEEVWGGRRGD
jgi:hypothetical protein